MVREKLLLHALRIMVVAAVAMVASGCSSTVGPAGPAGPAGPPGEDGNANVVAGVVEIGDADWTTGTYVYDSSPGSTTSRTARVIVLDVPEITQEIFDLGMVHVYMLVPEVLSGSPVQWAPLPYQYLAFGSTFFYNYAFTFDVGRLTLYYFHTTNFDGAVVPSPLSIVLPDRTFKYVVTSAAAIEAMAGEGVDSQDLDAVMRYLQRVEP